MLPSQPLLLLCNLDNDLVSIVVVVVVVVVLTNSVSIGSTTQHEDHEPIPMPIDQASWIEHKPELSADCLNAWVTYMAIHRTVLCTYRQL